MEKRLLKAQKILREYMLSSNKRFSVERYRLLEAIIEQPGEFTFLELLTYARRHRKIFAASTVYRNFNIYTGAGIVVKVSEKPTVYKVSIIEDLQEEE